MSEEKKSSKFLDKIGEMITAENLQKYVLGTNKSGQPRAVYDIVKDLAGGKKKKKKKKNSGGSSFDIFVNAKKGKKKKKKNKHWHIQ